MKNTSLIFLTIISLVSFVYPVNNSNYVDAEINTIIEKECSDTELGKMISKIPLNDLTLKEYQDYRNGANLKNLQLKLEKHANSCKEFIKKYPNKISALMVRQWLNETYKKLYYISADTSIPSKIILNSTEGIKKANDALLIYKSLHFKWLKSEFINTCLEYGGTVDKNEINLICDFHNKQINDSISDDLKYYHLTRLIEIYILKNDIKHAMENVKKGLLLPNTLKSKTHKSNILFLAVWAMDRENNFSEKNKYLNELLKETPDQSNIIDKRLNILKKFVK